MTLNDALDDGLRVLVQYEDDAVEMQAAAYKNALMIAVQALAETFGKDWKEELENMRDRVRYEVDDDEVFDVNGWCKKRKEEEDDFGD